MSQSITNLGCFRLLTESGSRFVEHGVHYKAICESDGFEGVPVGATVALKVLTAQGGEKGWLAKFQSRVEELKTLAHPGVARCFGYFCEPGPFGDMHVLVTEWLEGETLKDRLLRNPQGLDADEVVRIGCQVLSALTYVSTRGIAHRDIKPSNIFLCKDGTVKLIGFELSCETGRDGGVGWNGGREFPYLAPDFLDPEFSGDEQSDIFSVGVCLHEMLTGRLPYRQQQDGFIFSFMDRWRRGNEDIQMDKRIDRILQGATEVLAKALTSKREERYATFADFAAAFRGVRYRELTYEANTWRLLQHVGCGGFDEVFKARDIKTGQVVAIKHLSRHVDLFLRKARAFSLLNDSSFARIFMLFKKEIGGCAHAFLVMEYLDGMPGKTLRDELRGAGGRPLPRDVVLLAFARYAHGLSVLHTNGLVHHDIRPATLYFPMDAIDDAVILGFGIKIDVDSSVAEPPPPPNLDYLPPEAVDGSCRADAMMDIYALGLSLYEALSGKTAYPRLPTGSEGLLAFVKRTQDKTRPTIDESSYSDLPDLVRLVREMTAPDVNKRIKDAAEVERRLRVLLEEQNGIVISDDTEPQTLYAAPSYDELEKCQDTLSRKALLPFAALVVAAGCFWWGEACVRDTLPGLRQSLISVVVSLGSWNGHVMLGGYIFMAGALVLAAVARLLFRERKQHAEVVSAPSSTCAAETATPHVDFNVDDARTVTTTGSESHGLPDATCRDSDNLVSETEDGTDDPSAFLNLHGHATVHGFRLDPSPLVAEGGQGRVFKAECVEEGRLGLRKGTVVALKFVEETDQSPSFEEFEKAVAYLREIKSPHVPRYYGCFRVERRVNGKTKRFRMTVMECLDGADLAYRVKVRSPNFYADEIMYVLDQLLEGLCELAEAGVIHRDIKPSNIFICRDGTVKLIDFDTALIRGIDLCPKNRKIVGTPEFAAPDYLTEGFRGDEISDVFSVGMTLYYMVHGVSPHRAIGTLSDRMNELHFSTFWRERSPERGSEGWWAMEKEGACGHSAPLLGLRKVFSRALAEDRSHRFASFGEFRRSLSMVEFVRARYGKKGYLRVISDWVWISGAGMGYSCVYGRNEKGELLNWGRDGGCLVHPEQMDENERNALEKMFTRWWGSNLSLGFGCVDVRDLSPSCNRAPLVITEKFAAEKVKVVQTSFAKIKSPEEGRREVEEHEFQMQLS